MSDLVCVSFSAQAQGDADAVHAFVAPVGMMLVGAVVHPEAFTGTPTGFNIDVNAVETEVVKALAADTAGTAGVWKARHLGGSNAAVSVAAGTEVSIDINFAGGSTPTGDYDIQLWLLPGTV